MNNKYEESSCPKPTQPLDERQAAEQKARVEFLATFTMDELREEKERRSRLAYAEKVIKDAELRVTEAQTALACLREVLATGGVTRLDSYYASSLGRPYV